MRISELSNERRGKADFESLLSVKVSLGCRLHYIVRRLVPVSPLVRLGSVVVQYHRRDTHVLSSSSTPILTDSLPQHRVSSSFGSTKLRNRVSLPWSLWSTLLVRVTLVFLWETSFLPVHSLSFSDTPLVRFPSKTTPL